MNPIECIYCSQPIPVDEPHVTLGVRAAHLACIGKATEKLSEHTAEDDRAKAEEYRVKMGFNTPSVDELLRVWFCTTDITEQTHTDAVCMLVEKARSLERDRDKWREIAEGLARYLQVRRHVHGTLSKFYAHGGQL